MAKTLELFLSKGKNKFYLRDIVEESGLPLREVEDFFFPLLKENEVEGSLEVRCPECSSELGVYRQYPQIPSEIYCENCGSSFKKSSEDMEIIIEIKNKFFRIPPKITLNLAGRKLTESELEDFLFDSLKETDLIAKGKKFEYFFENFMAQQDGFTYIDRHCRSDVGEIDYFYRNQNIDHPLWKTYHYIFIECKNWNDIIPSKELSHFLTLMRRKSLFKCCGVYLTTSRLSPEANVVISDGQKIDNLCIFKLEKNNLKKLISIGFKRALEEACDKTIAHA